MIHQYYYWEDEIGRRHRVCIVCGKETCLLRLVPESDTMEKCCRAVCEMCAVPTLPVLQRGKWIHPVGEGYTPCVANAIRKAFEKGGG